MLPVFQLLDQYGFDMKDETKKSKESGVNMLHLYADDILKNINSMKGVIDVDEVNVELDAFYYLLDSGNFEVDSRLVDLVALKGYDVNDFLKQHADKHLQYTDDLLRKLQEEEFEKLRPKKRKKNKKKRKDREQAD